MRWLALLVGVLLVAAPAASAAPRKVPRGFYGASYEPALFGAAPQQGQWALMTTSGVESVRVSFHWSVAQPRRSGPIDWSGTDAVVALAAARRVSLLPVVVTAPEWAKARPGQLGAPPSNPTTYARYVGALVDRYGPRGSFWRLRRDLPRRPVRAWQIWNEPHFVYPWRAGGRRLTWWRGYVALLRQARRAIRRRDRRATIVLAGLANRAWNHVRLVYAGGGRGLFDAAAIHPYTRRPRDVLRAVRRFRAAMVGRGGRRERRRPIWVTEMGWAAARGRLSMIPPSNTWVTTDAGMARNLRAVYSLLARTRRSTGVRRAFWFTWATAYRGVGPFPVFDFTGLVRWDGALATWTPSLRAYARSARAAQGCAKTPTGACRR